MGIFQERELKFGASSADPAGWGLQPLREVTLIVV